MQSLFFWKNWSKPFQFAFWVLAGLAFIAILFFGYAYFQNPSLFISWDQFQQLELINVPIRNFSVGLETISVPADNYLLFETLAGSALQSAPWVFYIFLFFLINGFIVLLSIITTLKRFSFLIGMGLFILVMVSLHLETLQLFGLTNKISTIVVLLFFGGLAYYFHSFKVTASFLQRVVSFYSITIITGFCILFFSQARQPFLHLAVNGLVSGMVLCIVFIFLVAHEIVASFIYIVTQNAKPQKSARHFFVIAAIYFINLLISYLIKEGQLDWDFFVTNSIFLLVVSSVLSIWGTRNREPLYEDMLPSPALAIYFCLAMMGIAFATLFFFSATASNTMTEGLEDLILYSHLGYGLIFLVYVIANFAPMLMNNLPVHKVLYKPSTMPFFTFRAMGLIATYAFLSFASNWSSYVNQAYAAYYNAYGDLYYQQGEVTAAEGYFKKSILYRNQNHHAHYALATIYSLQLDPAKERNEYAEVCESSPSEISFINLSEAYGRNGNTLATSLVLSEGLKKFPTIGVLQNAQALTYSKLNSPDSALYFFQQARKSSLTKDMAETNLVAMSAKFKFSFPADSLLTLLGSDKAGAKSNALVLATTQQLPIEIKFELPSDTVLSVREATLMGNYVINQRKKIDTAVLSKIVSLARKPVNENFKEDLIVSAAQAFYEQGQVKKAADLVRALAYSTGKGKYFNLMGIWLLEQNNPATAANYFKVANEKSVSLALFYQAVANTEADSLAKAIPLWEIIAQSLDSVYSNKAKKMLVLLQTKNIPTDASDEEKYNFCRYKIPLTDSLQFINVVRSIGNEDLKAKALLDRSKKWFEKDEPEMAVAYLSNLRGLKLKDKTLAEDILYFNLLLAADRGNWDAIQKQLANDLTEGRTNEKIYLQALLDEKDNKQEAALKKFNYLASANIQFEEALLASAHFFLKDSTDRLKPYSILVNGLLAKPNSIKLLKAYVKEAAILGFDEESEQSLEKLKKLMSPRAFRRYVDENPDFFSVE
jgi:Tfp pilus assembly protein PilF